MGVKPLCVRKEQQGDVARGPVQHVMGQTWPAGRSLANTTLN